MSGPIQLKALRDEQDRGATLVARQERPCRSNQDSSDPAQWQSGRKQGDTERRQNGGWFFSRQDLLLQKPRDGKRFSGLRTNQICRDCLGGDALIASGRGKLFARQGTYLVQGW